MSGWLVKLGKKIKFYDLRSFKIISKESKAFLKPVLCHLIKFKNKKLIIIL